MFPYEFSGNFQNTKWLALELHLFTTVTYEKRIMGDKSIYQS